MSIKISGLKLDRRKNWQWHTDQLSRSQKISFVATGWMYRKTSIEDRRWDAITWLATRILGELTHM